MPRRAHRRDVLEGRPCAQCAELDADLRLGPHDFGECIVTARDLVDDDTLRVLYAAVPLAQVDTDDHSTWWCDDVVSFMFACTNCGRRFSLSADTYHGAASWRPTPWWHRPQVS